MAKKKPVTGPRRWWQWATSEQYQAIDAEYSREPLDRRVVGVLILTTLLLVALRYWGKTGFIMRIESARPWLAMLPTPELGAKMWWVACRFVGYFLLPAAIIHWRYGEKLSDYGLRLDTSKRILGLYLAMFATVVPLVFAVSYMPTFLNKYPLYHQANRSILDLLIWEAGYAVQFFALEFFFRGYLLFALAKRFGSHAIFIMTLPYVMIHFGKPVTETFAATLAGIALGTLALRTGSIFGGVVIHTAVGWSMDFFAMFQKNQLSRLFGGD